MFQSYHWLTFSPLIWLPAFMLFHVVAQGYQIIQKWLWLCTATRIIIEKGYLTLDFNRVLHIIKYILNQRILVKYILIQGIIAMNTIELCNIFDYLIRKVLRTISKYQLKDIVKQAMLTLECHWLQFLKFVRLIHTPLQKPTISQQFLEKKKG